MYFSAIFLITVAAQVIERALQMQNRQRRFSVRAGPAARSTGLFIEERDKYSFIGFRCKWTFTRDALNLPHRPHEQLNLVSRGFFQLAFEPLSQGSRIRLARLEDHISRLDVGLDILQPEGLEHLPQIDHFDDGIPADVDGAQEGDILHHVKEFLRRTKC